MATQSGPIVFEGTIGNITGYQMNGKHYVRMKSSLTRKRVKQDPCFSNTRRNAEWFAQAIRISKGIYRELPFTIPGKQKIWHPLRNRAQEWIRDGKPREEIIRLLKEEFILPLLKKNSPQQIPVQEELNVMRIPDELRLVDQLAASSAFVSNILSGRKQERTSSTR